MFSAMWADEPVCLAFLFDERHSTPILVNADWLASALLRASKHQKIYIHELSYSAYISRRSDPVLATSFGSLGSDRSSADTHSTAHDGGWSFLNNHASHQCPHNELTALKLKHSSTPSQGRKASITTTSTTHNTR